ncbi:BTAD domain-containing putative transcriptional regulator [Mycobacterium angelicum]|uniref:BTAD domain-containing putative transcriptional regulator n=1 Tax=Mycobacterium angelicum TaxID=470074 RepID=UPI001FE397BD|nr:BTAD domain-containing putative transcriptional regulator [Mycobacterium angelicum]
MALLLQPGESRGGAGGFGNATARGPDLPALAAAGVTPGQQARRRRVQKADAAGESAADRPAGPLPSGRHRRGCAPHGRGGQGAETRCARSLFEITCGRAESVIAELEALTAEHPLREPLRHRPRSDAHRVA